MTFNKNKNRALSRCQPWRTAEVLGFQGLCVPNTSWAHSDTVKVAALLANAGKPCCPERGYISWVTQDMAMKSSRYSTNADAALAGLSS